FDFADKEVSDVMVPRPEVVAISIALPAEEALKSVLESPYTRYPVYRESLDDIVAVLHIRGLIVAMHDRGIVDVDLESLVRPAYMVPETKDLGALLTEFRRTNQHLAVVIDEYGSMEGIVTLEDLLEEIVGEIEDEFDLPDETVEQIDDDTIRVDGTFTIDDFNERFNCDLPHEDYHTLAGFLFGRHGAPAAMAEYLVKVRDRAYAVSDADVEALRSAGCSEEEIFEQTVAVAIGEGLRRLDAARDVL